MSKYIRALYLGGTPSQETGTSPLAVYSSITVYVCYMFKIKFVIFVRWVLEKGPDRLHTGDVEAIFSLTDSDFTRSMWNCQFRVSYRYIAAVYYK